MVKRCVCMWVIASRVITGCTPCFCDADASFSPFLYLHSPHTESFLILFHCCTSGSDPPSWSMDHHSLIMFSILFLSFFFACRAYHVCLLSGTHNQSPAFGLEIRITESLFVQTCVLLFITRASMPRLKHGGRECERLESSSRVESETSAHITLKRIFSLERGDAEKLESKWRQQESCTSTCICSCTRI